MKTLKKPVVSCSSDTADFQNKLLGLGNTEFAL
jgi:hypothetical protein